MDMRRPSVLADLRRNPSSRLEASAPAPRPPVTALAGASRVFLSGQVSFIHAGAALGSATLLTTGGAGAEWIFQSLPSSAFCGFVLIQGG